jgi:unsaturated rhamnogalacturonyl hydrolase
VNLDPQQRRVLNALLAMQRQSWEQGVLGHALLDLEQWELAEVVARDSVVRQNRQGKLAEVDNAGIVNSGSVGEVVAWASIRDESLRPAVGRQLGWLMEGAPRAADGTLFHIEGSRELWVDSVYMVVPLLVLANEEEAALAQFRGHRTRLFDVGSGLWGSRYDEDEGRVIHSQHWGTGNGWVVAAIARAIHLGLRSAELADHAQTVLDALLALRRPDGSFTNIVDDGETFEENTVGLMAAYAMLQGVTDGWLSRDYADAGRSLVAHARTLVDEHGLVQRVCGAPHFDRQGTSAEAQAFFLMATAAEARLGS